LQYDKTARGRKADPDEASLGNIYLRENGCEDKELWKGGIS
jgi:hypothetical protein